MFEHCVYCILWNVTLVHVRPFSGQGPRVEKRNTKQQEYSLINYFLEGHSISENDAMPHKQIFGGGPEVVF